MMFDNTGVRYSPSNVSPHTTLQAARSFVGSRNGEVVKHSADVDNSGISLHVQGSCGAATYKAGALSDCQSLVNELFQNKFQPLLRIAVHLPLFLQFSHIGDNATFVDIRARRLRSGVS